MENNFCPLLYIKSNFQYWKYNSFLFTPIENSRNSKKVVPLENQPKFFGRDGFKDGSGYNFGAVFAEAGLSFHYDAETKTKYWGAPGMWNWTGTFVL